MVLMSVIPILLSRQIAKAHAPMLRRNVCKDSFSQARRALTRPGELKTPRNSLWFAELAEALNIRISKQCLHQTSRFLQRNFRVKPPFRDEFQHKLKMTSRCTKRPTSYSSMCHHDQAGLRKSGVPLPSWSGNLLFQEGGTPISVASAANPLRLYVFVFDPRRTRKTCIAAPLLCRASNPGTGKKLL